MRYCFWREENHHITFRQRAAGILNLLISLANLPPTFGLAVFLIYIQSGHPHIAHSTSSELRNIVRTACTLLISDWLDSYIVSTIIGYRAAIKENHASLWMAPCRSLPLLVITLALTKGQTQTSPSASSKHSSPPLASVATKPTSPQPAA